MNSQLPHRVGDKLHGSVPSLEDEAHGEAQLNAHHQRAETNDGPSLERIVLETVGLQWASQQAALDCLLRRVDGVESVEVNPVSQTATVAYDPTRTDLATMREAVHECGQTCAGESVPHHVCDPMQRAQAAATATAHLGHHEPPLDEPSDTMSHAGHVAPARHAQPAGASPHEMMGHGGHGAMSMDDMVADMRRRFLVAALFSIPILLWSPIGRDVIGFDRRCTVRAAR